MLLAMLSSCMAAWQSYLFQHFVHSKIHVSKFGSFHYLEIATFDQKFLGRLGAGLSSISLTPNLEDCASSCPLVSSPADWFNTAVVPLVPSTELSSLIFRSRCCIMRILCESLDMDCDDSVGIADNEVLRGARNDMRCRRRFCCAIFSIRRCSSTDSLWTVPSDRPAKRKAELDAAVGATPRMSYLLLLLMNWFPILANMPGWLELWVLLSERNECMRPSRLALASNNSASLIPKFPSSHWLAKLVRLFPKSWSLVNGVGFNGPIGASNPIPSSTDAGGAKTCVNPWWSPILPEAVVCSAGRPIKPISPAVTRFLLTRNSWRIVWSVDCRAANSWLDGRSILLAYGCEFSTERT